MRGIILAGIALASLVSCGSSSKLKTQKDLSLETNLKENLNQTESQKTIFSLDTTAIIKGGFYLGSIDYGKFISGEPLVTEDERHKTKTYYDKTEGKVKTETEIKPDTIRVLVKKTITTYKTLTRASELKAAETLKEGLAHGGSATLDKLCKGKPQK